MPVRILAKEEGCVEGPLCLESAEGTMPEVRPGRKLEIELENRGDEVHGLHVAAGEDADRAHEETPVRQSLADVGPVEPGSTGRTSVAVPDVETLYLWCGLGTDESRGMWMEVPVVGSEGYMS